jgi:transposase-like protein
MQKYTSEERQAHLEAFKKGKLSGQEYCRRNNISPTTFYGWTKRKKKLSKINKKGEINFIKMATGKAVPEVNSQAIVIEYGNIRISLPTNCSKEHLKTILSYLDSHNAS